MISRTHNGETSNLIPPPARNASGGELDPSVSLAWVAVPALGDLLVRSAERWPDCQAIVMPEARTSFAGLLRATETKARALLGLGVTSGDHVAILMPTSIELAEIVFACATIGAVAIPVNGRFRHRELTHVLRDSNAVAVVTSAYEGSRIDRVSEIRNALAGAPSDVRSVVVFGEAADHQYIAEHAFLSGAEAVGRQEVHRIRHQVRVSQPAIISYTSGTTSNPKGCVLTHEALLRAALAAAERWQLAEGERFWDPLPMSGMGGIYPLIATMSQGATFLTAAHFDPAVAIRLMIEEGCTFAYPLFPTITQSLIGHPDFAVADLSAVRCVVDTGPPSRLRSVQDHWPEAKLITMYGSTEAGGCVAIGSVDDPLDKRTGTGGLPLRGVEVRVVSSSGATVPRGEPGEILVRSPGLFTGYYNDETKNREAFQDGWFRTGDLGTLDEDGRVTFRGRLKDMLKIGGENVAALEIEEFLESHPAVKIAQVVSIPDAKYVEVPAAFVELAAGNPVTPQALIEYCSGRIARYKIPRHIRIVAEWPMSATKIQKGRLREQLLSELAPG